MDPHTLDQWLDIAEEIYENNQSLMKWVLNELKLYQNIVYLTDAIIIIIIIMKTNKTLFLKAYYLEEISQLWMCVNKNE